MPSVTRWYTFSPHLVRQACGLFTIRVLPRVVKRTFEADEADQQPDEEAQDYHKAANRKKAQALAFFEDEGSAKIILGTALVAR